MPDADTLGALLRRLRTEADLTLEQLAEASGVSDRAISDMERGVSRGPQARTMAAIADALALGDEDRSALLAAARAGRRRDTGNRPGPGNRCPMPRRVPDFTGRRQELDHILARAAAARAGEPAPVVLVSGSPGLGKTSLAVQVATELTASDGRYFVDLRGLDAQPLPPTAVLDRLIRAVEPSTGAVPRSLEDASALWRSLIQGRRIVVVLDNAASESQVRPALPEEGPAIIVVTSRRTLGGLEGVDRLMLDPLPDEVAVRMLAGIAPDRAKQTVGLAQLARLCANVPLALRIAGNRLASRPGWSADDLAGRLTARERRLEGLSVGDLEVKAAFELSYQQLSGVGRRLFRRLALVPGPSTGVELTAVLVDEQVSLTEEALDELLDLGMLQQGDDGRFFFHDLLRLYSGNELNREESVGDRRAAAGRARDWLLDTTIVAGRWYEPEYGAPPPGAARLVDLDTAEVAREWLQAEAENWLPALRQAAAEGEHQRVVDVAESLHWFSDLWAHWGHWHEVYGLSAEAADRLGDDHLRAVHRGYLAWAYIYPLGHPDEGFRQAELAHEHARRTGDVTQQGWARLYCSWALGAVGRYKDALWHARESAARFETARDRAGLPQALGQVGQLLRRLGRLEEAMQAYHAVLATVTRPETAPPVRIARFTEMTMLGAMANLHLQLEQWQLSVERATESLRIAEELGHRGEVLKGLRRRADAYLGLGDTAAALTDLRAAAEVQREIGDEAGLRDTRRRLDELRGG